MNFFKGFRVGILALVLSLNAVLFGQNQFVENLNIHGFLSQGFMKSSDNNFLGNTSEGTLEFNEIGLNMSYEVFDDLRVGAQLLSRDLGREGNNAVFIDWAFADYSFQDWLGIRAGKIKMPLGLYNEYRDLDIARTNIFLPQGSYIESWRESFTALTGVGLYGSFDGSDFYLGELNYQFQAGVIDLDKDSGLNWTIEDELNADLTKYEITPSYVASLVWETPLDGLKLGASFWNTEEIKGTGKTPNNSVWRNRSIGAAQDIAAMASLPNPTTYDEALNIFNLSGIDLNLVNIPMVQKISDIKASWFSVEYTWEDLIVAYERYRLDSHGTTTSPGWGAALSPDMEQIAEFETVLGGYYFSLGYQINEQFAASTYHSEFYIDVDNNSSSTGRLIDTAFSLRYDYDSNWTIKGEMHKMNGTAVMYDADQVDPNNLETNWYLFASKLTYNF